MSVLAAVPFHCAALNSAGREFGQDLSAPCRFNVDLGFAQTAFSRRLSQCVCCPPSRVPALSSSALQADEVLPLYADPAEISRARDEEVDHALNRVFGAEGLRLLFGQQRISGARRLQRSGMNHVFMVTYADRLLKCVERKGCPETSEVRETHRLRREAPRLIEDSHAVFPLVARGCRRHHEHQHAPDAPQYEVLVFEYLEGAQSLGELIRIFERTHGHMLKHRSPCTDYSQTGSCEHLHQLNSLIVTQAPFLSQRFQVRHGQRHGDFKADNILIDREGRPRLVDFLSPFCTACDREEFMTSICSTHPAITQMRDAACSRWQASASMSVPSANSGASPHWSSRAVTLPPPSQSEFVSNLRLIESLEKLMAISSSRTECLFGPVPSLLGKIGWSSSCDFPLNADFGVKAFSEFGFGKATEPVGPSTEASVVKPFVSQEHNGLACIAEIAKWQDKVFFCAPTALNSTAPSVDPFGLAKSFKLSGETQDNGGGSAFSSAVTRLPSSDTPSVARAVSMDLSSFTSASSASATNEDAHRSTSAIGSRLPRQPSAMKFDFVCEPQRFCSASHSVTSRSAVAPLGALKVQPPMVSPRWCEESIVSPRRMSPPVMSHGSALPPAASARAAARVSPPPRAAVAPATASPLTGWRTPMHAGLTPPMLTVRGLCSALPMQPVQVMPMSHGAASPPMPMSCSGFPSLPAAVSFTHPLLQPVAPQVDPPWCYPQSARMAAPMVSPAPVGGMQSFRF